LTARRHDGALVLGQADLHPLPVIVVDLGLQENIFKLVEHQPLNPRNALARGSSLAISSYYVGVIIS